ncbi:uncharacterized protein VTP21DRAFT_10280 [Calcarisporiella thermophila]|uniref:uncharacterized protein n=1 Tax=Calcarisporiella thermophila TaxID=911321 RepID=UPI0037429D5E
MGRGRRWYKPVPKWKARVLALRPARSSRTNMNESPYNTRPRMEGTRRRPEFGPRFALPARPLECNPLDSCTNLAVKIPCAMAGVHPTMAKPKNAESGVMPPHPQNKTDPGPEKMAVGQGTDANDEPSWLGNALARNAVSADNRRPLSGWS